MKNAETPEIDLRDIDLRAVDLHEIDLRDDAPPVDPTETVSGFSWAGLLGGLSAIAWVVAAGAAVVSYFGLNAVAEMHPAIQAVFVAVAFGPAILIWLGAAAAAEATRARRLAARMEARAAFAPAAPGPDTEEARARRESLALRAEIEDLNAAVEDALSRLGEIEHAASRNIAAFENAISVGGQGAGALNALMERERSAMTALNAEFRAETETLARNVSRQIRLIQEAAKLFQTEVAGAENAMADQASRFTDAADALSERTAAIHAAADAAESASGRLDDVLATALDNLSHATSLNEASRESVEHAAAAANAVAQTVRDASVRAVGDARRAAQLVREETTAMEEVANTTFARLREAAEAARSASEDSQAAADRHAGAIEKRLAAMAETAKVARRQPQPTVQAQTSRVAAYAAEDQPMQAAAGGTARGSMSFARKPASAPASAPAPRVPTRFGGEGDWLNMLPDDSDALHFEAANERAADPFGFAEQPLDPDAAIVAAAIDVCRDAGLTMDETLAPEDMERIAGRARFGAVARRRAVADAAPAAVRRLAAHLRRTPQAKAQAQEFRARPDLAKVNRRGDNPDVIVAYLLIDAALA